MADLQELKKEATELGVVFAKNISAEKLAERIDEFYEKQETPNEAVTEALAEVNAVKESPEEVGAKKPVKGKTKEELFHEKRFAREKAAKVMKIISIVDNDQRVNNHTTTCTVNCSNEYFDLGTVILPLNEKIEVAVGHIRALESVQIPLHIADIKTGMSSVRMRPRYTITYENTNP